jgi:competence protein ComEA helix-hairpin-helix repeat region
MKINTGIIRDFLDEYGPQMRKMAVICLVGLVLFAGFSLFRGSGDSEVQDRSSAGASDVYAADAEETGGTIFVDIGGAVQNPMLAELPEGSRVDDAIQAAGGLKQEADMTSINRAEFLEDGQKVFVPSMVLDEEGNLVEASNLASASVDTASTAAMGKVNINTADSTQLQTLNGVGPATAQKIIDYRESNGRFSSIEDIKNVSGIGDKTFEKLKDHITT